jgi:hypothetical protein
MSVEAHGDFSDEKAERQGNHSPETRLARYLGMTMAHVATKDPEGRD